MNKNIYNKVLLITASLTLAVIWFACAKPPVVIDSYFNAEQELQLGNLVQSEIIADQQHFKVVDTNTYTSAYYYLNGLLDTVLEHTVGAKQAYYRFRIYLMNDSSIRIFGLSNGSIFISTGLIKLLPTEEQLIGILSHQVNHILLKDAINVVSDHYGVYYLNVALVYNNLYSLGSAHEIIGNSKYSYTQELKADTIVVPNMVQSTYDSRGLARFLQSVYFEPNELKKTSFNIMHRDYDLRVQAIYSQWVNYGSVEGKIYQANYQALKLQLP